MSKTKIKTTPPAAIECLEKLIDQCPGEWIVRLFRRHRRGFGDPDQHAIEIMYHLREIEQSAVFGHKHAIGTLAAIGCHIADFLSELAGDPADRMQENPQDLDSVRRGSGNLSGWRACYRRMRDSLLLLFATPHKDLKKYLDTLRVVRYNKPHGLAPTAGDCENERKRVRKHILALAGNERLLLPEASGMFSSLVWSGARRASGGPAAAMTTTPGHGQGSKDMPEGREHPPTLCAEKTEVDLIMDELLDRRLRQLAREGVLSVLGHSESWPLRVNAFGNRRSTEPRNTPGLVGLGNKLGFCLPRGKANNEEVRRFANGVFTTLERERREWLNKSDAHRQQLKDYELSLAARPTPVGFKEDLLFWNSNTHWRRKAAILPRLAEDCLTAWVDAGIAYLEHVAASDSYRKEVVEPNIHAETRRPLFRRCRSCREGGLESPECPDCAKIVQTIYSLGEGKIERVRAWEKGVAEAVKSYDWPEFVNKRIGNTGRSVTAVLKDKLASGFKTLLNSNPPVGEETGGDTEEWERLFYDYSFAAGLGARAIAADESGRLSVDVLDDLNHLVVSTRTEGHADRKPGAYHQTWSVSHLTTGDPGIGQGMGVGPFSGV